MFSLKNFTFYTFFFIVSIKPIVLINTFENQQNYKQPQLNSTFEIIFRARFNMPGDSEGLWYSFNMGPVHFIGITTEVYYFMNYGLKQLVKQYEWLEKDLTEANKPENR